MERSFGEKKPVYSLLLLLGLMLVVSVSIQAVFIGALSVFTSENFLAESDVSDASPEYMLYMKILLIVSSLSTFMIPALWLQHKERQFNYFPTYRLQSYIPYILTFCFLLSFAPLMNKIGEWNMNMKLPESWGALEAWMRESEDKMAALTKRIVMDPTWTGLLINTVVLALIPAIAEEFFFRGALQGILLRWFGSNGVAIWVTAIIFSAIHFQFYGFLPRMVLGLFFGYLLVWSGNIWLPIFAHFVNNFSVTLIAFIYTRQGKTYEELQMIDDYPIFLYLASIPVSAYIGWRVYTYFKNKNKNMEKDWTKIREFNNAIEAELEKQMLEANGVPAVLLNKKDSSYLFGKVELYINKDNVSIAEQLLNNQEKNEKENNED